MNSILVPDNSQNVIEYALAAALVEESDEPKPEGEPDAIDRFARGVIINHDITVRVAFEVVLHMRDNFSTEIEYGEGYCRILSHADFSKVAKHAMHVLSASLIPYRRALKKMEDVSEIAHQISGIFYRDQVVNILTGNGIHFTEVSKLYYDGTCVNKLDVMKVFMGLKDPDESFLFYSSVLPTPQKIAIILSRILRA